MGFMGYKIVYYKIIWVISAEYNMGYMGYKIYVSLDCYIQKFVI